jgi:transcriptional regulator with PAS, ATPase and Fis domain
LGGSSHRRKRNESLGGHGVSISTALNTGNPVGLTRTLFVFKRFFHQKTTQQSRLHRWIGLVCFQDKRMAAIYRGSTRAGDRPVAVRPLAVRVPVASASAYGQFGPTPAHPEKQFCKHRSSDLVGISQPMQKVYALIQRVSQFKFPVLVLGESGTGKELVARAIHTQSQRRSCPFVPVDCAALVPALMESELFGHMRGAFTGATDTKRGLLETAKGGTLFLDEIGELHLEMQVKLLRAIQEQEIRPVGATALIHTDVRIIAATNRDLEKAVRTGAFRQDLYFRLNIVQIKLSPLRNRKEDIPQLVRLFLEKFADLQPSIRGLSDEATERLMAYDWPGNVRELENAIEHALALGSGPMIEVGDLPSSVQADPLEEISDEKETLSLSGLERRAIYRALTETNGDVVAAAHLLRMGKTTVYRKLKQYRAEGNKRAVGQISD